MATPGLRAYLSVKRQASEAVSRISSQVANEELGLYRDLSVLVAHYACEGAFYAPSDALRFLSVADGHWWSIARDGCHVESSYFPGSLWFAPAQQLPSPRAWKLSFVGELLDGSLLIVFAWHNARSGRCLESLSVTRTGAVASLWSCRFERDVLWPCEACLVGAASAERKETLELVMPCAEGFLVFDALHGGPPRLVQIPTLLLAPRSNMHLYNVFEGDRDLLLLLDWTMSAVYVFSWRAQSIIATWKHLSSDGPNHAFLQSAGTVHLVDFDRAKAFAHHVSTGELRNTVHFAPLLELASWGRDESAPSQPKTDWVTVRQFRGRMYAFM